MGVKNTTVMEYKMLWIIKKEEEHIVRCLNTWMAIRNNGQMIEYSKLATLKVAFHLNGKLITINYLQTKSKFNVPCIRYLGNSISHLQWVAKCLHHFRSAIIVPYVSSKTMHSWRNTCSKKPWMSKKCIWRWLQCPEYYHKI